MGTETRLPVETRMDLLIALLYSPGSSESPNEPIDGITRLQKLLFLLGKEKSPKKILELASDFQFRPYKMGPYADSVMQDLDELEAAGIIRRSELEYWIRDDGDKADEENDHDSDEGAMRHVLSDRFSLTELGERIGQDLLKSMSDEERILLTEFKARFNSLSLRQLLRFVYSKFPDFTIHSAIKDNLGLQF